MLKSHLETKTKIIRFSHILKYFWYFWTILAFITFLNIYFQVIWHLWAKGLKLQPDLVIFKSILRAFRLSRDQNLHCKFLRPESPADGDVMADIGPHPLGGRRCPMDIGGESEAGSLSGGANKSRRLIYATATATAKAKIFEKRVFRFLMAAHKFQH